MEQNRTNPIEEILGQAMGKLKTMIDVNTIVGDPIANTQGAIILPISKVSLGFVAGGGEYTNGTKKPKNCARIRLRAARAEVSRLRQWAF